MVSSRGTQQMNPPERVFEQYPDDLLEKERLCCMGDFVRGVIHNVNGYLQNLYMLGEMLADGQQRQDSFTLARCRDSREEWERLSASQRRRLDKLSRQMEGLAGKMKDLMLLSETEPLEKDVQLNFFLEKLVDVFQADLFVKHRVTLDLQLEADLPMVRILGSDLITALVHIIRNVLAAVQDAPEKRLTVRSRHEEGFIRLDFRASSRENVEDRQWNEGAAIHAESKVVNGRMMPSRGENRPDFDLFAVHRLLSAYGVIVRVEELVDGALTIVEIPVAQKRQTT